MDETGQSRSAANTGATPSARSGPASAIGLTTRDAHFTLNMRTGNLAQRIPAMPITRLPDFIAVGPPRTGTTWLHGLLYHRACLPADLKETRYFDLFYARGPRWYGAFFRHCDGARPVGEITPAYFGSRAARARIARDLPHCKIVCTLREPAARAWSHYRKMQRNGQVVGTLEQELLANDLLRESSHYGGHLSDWFETFGERNVGVFFYDDLQTNPQRFADAVCAFVGLEPVALTPDVARHLDRNEVTTSARFRTLAACAFRLRMWLQGRRAYRTIGALERAGLWRLCAEGGEPFAALTADTRARVRELLRPEVESVERLTGRELSAWKEPSAEVVRTAPAAHIPMRT